MSKLIKPIWPDLEYAEKKVISIKAIRTAVPEVKERTDKDVAKENADLIKQAKSEAEQIRQSAKAEYEAIMKDIEAERHSWQEERKLLIEEAREEGYQCGWNEGWQAGYEEYRKHIEEAKGIISAAKEDYLAYLASSEKVILDLAVAIAEKIMAKKVEEDAYLASFVKKALKEVKECQDIRLHVHPQNYDFLLSQKGELLEIFSNEANLFIYPDDEMSIEGCIIESETGRIDAGIDTQLGEIKKVLTEMLESEAS